MIDTDLLTMIAIGFVIFTVCIVSLSLTWEILQDGD